MNVRGKKVVVVGLGRTAVALTRLLLREGGEPFVTEQGAGKRFAPHAAALDALGVSYETGGHSREAFAHADVVIPSPGVPPRIEPIRQCVYSGVPLLGEMDFAFRFAKAPVLAVTGTNGKTTTTHLLRHCLERCGKRVLLAGNNDQPFSAAVLEDPPEYYVLEVSSYQLETAWVFRPWIGAVLNVTPDHLERHGSMAQYACIKGKLFARQQQGDAAVVNGDDDWAADLTPPSGVRHLSFSMGYRVLDGLWAEGDTVFFADSTKNLDVEALPLDAIALPGRHNRENALAALTMLWAGGFDWDLAVEGVRTFRGVEHRIEHIAEKDGVAFVNDSKATNLDSLRVALNAFEGNVVLVAGGRGKEGADYTALNELAANKLKGLVLLGEEADKMAAAWGGLCPTVHADSMESAVAQAADMAVPEGIVLLSPACASFDMFDDFEHRGRVFKECVQRLVEGNGP